MDRASTFGEPDRRMRGYSVRAAWVWAIAWIAGILVLGTFVPVRSWAQDAQPVKLIELIGPRAVFDGEVVNYRARVDDASTKPIGFLWDFGDGIASEGTLVAHRYRTPGVYAVTLVAYNTAGRDTLRARIRVTERPEEPVAAPTASAPDRAAPRPGSDAAPTIEETAPQPISRTEVRKQLFGHDPIQPTTTGYTWILISDLWNERIQRTLLQYRLQGIRVEIMEETQGRGSRVYRIIAGHFPTIGQALMARSMLNLGLQTTTLHSFSPDGLQLAVANLPSAIQQLPERDRRWINDLTRAPTPLVADAEGGEPTQTGAAPAKAETSAIEAPVVADAAPSPTEAHRAKTNDAGTTSTSSTTASASGVAISPPVTASPPAGLSTGPSTPAGFPAWVWVAAGMIASMAGGVTAFLWYGRNNTQPVAAGAAASRINDPPPEAAAKKAEPPIVLQQTDRRRLPIQHPLIQKIHRQPPPPRPSRSMMHKRRSQPHLLRPLTTSPLRHRT